MKKQRRLGILLAVLLFVVAAAGCARKSEQTRVENILVKQEVDWNQGFVTGEVNAIQPWNSCDFRKVNRSVSGEGEYIGGSSRTDNLKGYVETAIYKVAESKNYYIKYFSPEGIELGETFLDQSDWGTKEENIFAYDVVGECMYFGIMEWGAGQSTFRLPEHVYIVSTDREGKREATIDISAGLASLGCDTAPSFFEVDGDGYIYIRTWDDTQMGTLYVTDGEGKGVLSYQCDTPMMDSVFTPVRDNTGRLFIPIYKVNEKATLLLWRNDENQWEELARIEEKTISDWYGMDENIIYYRDDNMLVRWDVVTGEGEQLLNLKENSFEGMSGKCMMAFDAEGEMYLRNRTMGKDWVVRVTPEPLPYKGSLVFGTQLEGSTAENVIAGAIMYSREYAVPVEVQDERNKEGESRMLMDMVNGKGPDIMYVSSMDMKNLKGNDALLDIGELIPETVKESLLPQALESGTIDGVLYGIPVDMDLHVMFTSKELWSEKNWTMEDVFGVLERNSELEYMFTSSWSVTSPINYLLFYDFMQGKSRFIDWEKGISRFEEMDFMSVLKMLQPYEAAAKASGLEDGMELFLSGKSLGYIETQCDPFTFNALMNRFGDGCHALGLPAEDGVGTYLEASKYLVVNSNVSEQKKELISEFLSYMLGEDVQREISTYALSVIEGLVYDELEDNIRYDEDTKHYYYEVKDAMRRLVYVKEDGTAYMKEYKELIENAQTLNGDMTTLFLVIGEEIASFITGERTALEVTRKIDNRTQLYLDENK